MKILPFETKKDTVEMTHTRQTYLVKNELIKRMDELAEGKERGFKTFLVNYAIEQILNELGPDATEHASENRDDEKGVSNVNPITAMRQKHGLSKTQLAMIAGVDIMTVKRVERGESMKLSGKILIGVRTLGEDEETLIAQYAVWRTRQAQNIKSK